MKRIKKFFSDFKAFISRGNVIDMAVGVIIGGAFSAIVTALANKIIMPIINWLLSLGGTNGLESAYTFLRKVWTVDADGNTVVDLAKSIYIDWGAFITAIIDFLLIALVLFIILKVAMNARGYIEKSQKAKPTKAEKAQLKEQGVDLKDREAVKVATAALREANKPAPQPPKPTQEELLSDILQELKKQNQLKQDETVETEEKPVAAKTTRKKKAL